jgi:hypothetical protein
MAMTQEQIIVLVSSSLHQIASFKDTCRSWFRKNNLDARLVFDCIKSSRELQIIMDLDNFPKHDGERRVETGQSGLFRRLRGCNERTASEIDLGQFNFSSYEFENGSEQINR